MSKNIKIRNIKPGSVYRYVDKNNIGEFIDLTFLVLEKRYDYSFKVKYILDKSNDGSDWSGNIRVTNFEYIDNDPPDKLYELDKEDILSMLGEIL